MSFFCIPDICVKEQHMPKIKEVFVSKVSDFIEVIKNCHAEVPRVIFWYRGQRDEEWDVLPGIFRDNEYEYESNYVHRFRSRQGPDIPNSLEETSVRYG